MLPTDPANLLKELIRCPSVTPEDAGALDVLEAALGALGFNVDRVVFSDQDTADVDNLYARLGSTTPHLMFAGHTDVVPPGEVADWRHPPFAAVEEDGIIYGRGAVDMKGGIAAFVAATARFVEQYGEPAGAISFLITGDEEGPSINGTEKLLRWAVEKGESWQGAIVGEPTNPQSLGDAIKIGRRGSVSGKVTVTGRQGHSAYPELASNPIDLLLALAAGLTAPDMDEGSQHFQPTRLVITSIDVGNRATNVIPARASLAFNVRFNELWDGQSIKGEIKRRLAKACGATDDTGAASYELDWVGRTSPVFLTRDEHLTQQFSNACEAVTGRRPALSTNGGTSDARFIKDYCPVIEFGLVGQTMHQTDERVEMADLERLTQIYEAFLKNWFGKE